MNATRNDRPGRMGSNMVQRLMKAGHECVVSDRHPLAVKDVVAKGASRPTHRGFCEKTQQTALRVDDGSGGGSSIRY